MRMTWAGQEFLAKAKNDTIWKKVIAQAEEKGMSTSMTRSTPYTLQGACALIENLGVFHSFERLGLEPLLAIWTSDKSSNRFIDWLAANVKNGLRVLHLPDYDPVGLTEFLRHHERLGEAVTLYASSAESVGEFIRFGKLS